MFNVFLNTIFKKFVEKYCNFILSVIKYSCATIEYTLKLHSEILEWDILIIGYNFGKSVPFIS